MKRLLLPTLIVSALGAALLVTSVFAATPNDFRGVWTATDADGSNEVMLISGRNADHMRVLLYDDGATFCGVDENNVPLYGAIYIARGQIVGDDLETSGRIICLSSPASVSPIGTTFAYDSGTDTLDDGFATWSPWP